MKETAFRLWLMNIYMEHKDEADTLGLPTCDAKTYFRMYKYWLKREFKYRSRIRND